MVLFSIHSSLAIHPSGVRETVVGFVVRYSTSTNENRLVNPVCRRRYARDAAPCDDTTG